MMDWYPVLFNAELVIFIIALVLIAKSDAVRRWERRIARRIRRRKAARKRQRPAMTAEEVVAVCNSLRYGS